MPSRVPHTRRAATPHLSATPSSRLSPPGRGPRSARSSARRLRATQPPVTLPRQRCLARRNGTAQILRHCRGDTQHMVRLGLGRALPALSSASIPHRSSSADTRPASILSGVTSAAVRPGVSTASRKARAIAWASAAGSGSSAARMPVSRRSAGLRPFHLSLKSAAVIALATARPRTAGAAEPPDERHSCTSSRLTPGDRAAFSNDIGMAPSPRIRSPAPSSSGPSASLPRPA